MYLPPGEWDTCCKKNSPYKKLWCFIISLVHCTAAYVFIWLYTYSFVLRNSCDSGQIEQWRPIPRYLPNLNIPRSSLTNKHSLWPEAWGGTNEHLHHLCQGHSVPSPCTSVALCSDFYTTEWHKHQSADNKQLVTGPKLNTERKTEAPKKSRAADF